MIIKPLIDSQWQVYIEKVSKWTERMYISKIESNFTVPSSASNSTFQITFWLNLFVFLMCAKSNYFCTIVRAIIDKYQFNRSFLNETSREETFFRTYICPQTHLQLLSYCDFQAFSTLILRMYLNSVNYNFRSKTDHIIITN